MFLASAVFSGAAPLQIRVATFNASLNRNAQGQLASDLSTGANNQARRIAEIIQRIAPDILLVNEFDYDATNASLALNRFHDNYLAVSQNGQRALLYPHRYIAPSNTGVHSGFDLNNNGVVDNTRGDQGYGDDAFGFGEFPGKYSFAVYSKFPIQTAAIRTLQLFRWKDMPGAVLPDMSGTPAPEDWYSTAELNVFRLSSKNHVDLPVEVAPGHVVHLLASHPTPPAFDGAEDRNGRRNHDEIRLWADYLSNASYIYDDVGVRGGLAAEARFIVLGDLNADPLDGDSFQSAVNQLRDHPLVNSSVDPASAGGTQQSQLQGGINLSQRGNPAFDTSDFSQSSAGNLRVDHLLPSKGGFSVAGSGVFWPLNTDPGFDLLYLSASRTESNQTTDHRLVYLDLIVLPLLNEAVRGLAARREGDDVVLTWDGQAGVTYGVETSTDLLAWTPAPQIPVTVDAETFSASAREAGVAGAPPRFYRVVASIEATSPPQARAKTRKRRR